MPHADLERRLEALTPPEPRGELEHEILGAVETSLARAGRRTRLLLAATGAGLLMAVVFVLGMDSGNEVTPVLETAPVERAADDPAVDREPPARTQGAPGLTLDLPPNGLDFKDVRQGVALDRYVTFRNVGTTPVCVLRVTNGCGCIRAELIGSETCFEPGWTGRVRVTLQTKGREGRLRKTVTLHTDDAVRPRLEFSVHANVAAGLRVLPNFLNFGRTTVGRPVTGVVRLRAPKADGPWAVLDVGGKTAGSEAWIDYEYEVAEIEDPVDRVFEIRIQHPSLPAPGSRQEQISIRTTHPDRGSRTVRAHVLVTEPILAAPRRAVLGFVPSDLVTRIQLVGVGDTTRFEILGHAFEALDGTPLVEGESGFAATFGANAHGNRWVDLRYDPIEREPGPLKAILVIRTNVEAMPEVRIECYATLRR